VLSVVLALDGDVLEDPGESEFGEAAEREAEWDLESLIDAPVIVAAVARVLDDEDGLSLARWDVDRCAYARDVG